MSFLLDGLHEDLNRVKRKPYIEAKNADGRSDRVLAKEAWTNYLKRNDSIVTDTFHGLLKSTLVCPDCKHVSVTFDPSCFLSLPLPHRKDKVVGAIAFLNEPRKPSKLRVYIPVYPSKCTGNEFYSIVSKLTQVPAERLVATIMDPFDKRPKCLIEPNDDEVDDVMDLLYIYELPMSPWSKEGSLMRVYNREVPYPDIQNVNPSTSATIFGLPFYLYSPTKQISVDDLYDMAFEWLKGRFLKVRNGVGDDDLSEDEEPMDADSGADAEKTADKENGPHVANRLPENQTLNSTEGPGEKRRLFTVSLVNEMCNTSLATVNRPSNGEAQEAASTTRDETGSGEQKMLTLTSRAYVALDWVPNTRRANYEENVQPPPSTYSSVGNSANKRPVTLAECLKLFTTTEKLGAEDLWYCPACKKHQQATKKFDLWSLPNVLIIHLKRFSYNRYIRDKIDTLVEFPIKDLKMGPFVLDSKHKSATYDLIGVANHYGGMGGGHCE